MGTFPPRAANRVQTDSQRGPSAITDGSWGEKRIHGGLKVSKTRTVQHRKQKTIDVLSGWSDKAQHRTGKKKGAWVGGLPQTWQGGNPYVHRVHDKCEKTS